MKTLALAVALAFLLLIAIAPMTQADGGYVGRPIWMRNGFKNAASFDGCITDPINPNPIDARVATATVAAAGNETTVVIAISAQLILPGFAGCANPATATQISTVKDSNGVNFIRLGGSLITLTGAPGAVAVEAWASTVGGTGASSTGVTVTYPAARLAHSFEVFVYRQVAFRSAAPIEKNETSSTFMIWTKTFNSTNQVLASIVTADQPSGCNGNPPDCGYPSGTGPGAAGPNEAANVTIPCTPPTDVSKHCSDSGIGGGYRFGGSSVYPEWGAFQVNVSRTGARSFGYFLSSPTPTKEIFGGVFVNGPDPPPPGPDTFSSQVVDSFMVFGFIALLVLAVLGAIELRRRFS